MHQVVFHFLDEIRNVRHPIAIHLHRADFDWTGQRADWPMIRWRWPLWKIAALVPVLWFPALVPDTDLLPCCNHSWEHLVVMGVAGHQVVMAEKVGSVAVGPLTGTPG